LIAALAITTWLALPIAAQSQRSVFERARLLDESNQNLAEAIKLYSQVAGQATTDRPLAAQAELRVGVLYQRLGRSADARTAFETVVRRYADQAEPARLARVHLAAVSGETAGAQTDPSFALTPLQIDGAGQAVLGWSMAPDGKRVAVEDLTPLALNVAAYDLGTRTLTALTHYHSPSYAFGPVWSPDSAEMAFSLLGVKPMEIRATTMGGAVRTLTRAADNERLVATDWLKDGSAIVTLQNVGNACSVGLIPAAGGPYTSLGPASCGDLTKDFASRPMASPDSRFIAFEDGAVGRRSIAVIGVDGHAVSTVADHPADDAQPFWSPDGKHLVFMSARSGSWALWGTAMDEGQAVGTPFKIRDGMKDVFLLGWSSRGLAYLAVEFGSDVFTLDVDPRTGAPTGTPSLVEFQRTGRNFSPAWSPNGKYAAFVSQDAQVDSRRFIVTLGQAGGKTQEFIIPTSAYVDAYGPRNLRWFSDNSGIGFAGLNDKRQPSVFRLTLATGAWETMPLPEDGPIDWMPGGTAFVYVAGKGTPQARLVTHEFASGQERQLSNVDPAFGAFRLAPDGKSVAFSQRGAGKGVFVMDFATSQIRRVAPTEGSATWSPDGRRLVVSQTNDRGQTGGLLETVDLATGSSTVVWREPAPETGISFQLAGQAEWSQDGMRLIFNQVVSKHLYWNLGSPIPPGARAVAKKTSR
jgi:Tol biopolymer transport system component